MHLSALYVGRPVICTGSRRKNAGRQLCTCRLVCRQTSHLHRQQAEECRQATAHTRRLRSSGLWGKMSKKDQCEYHAKQRRTWGELNPVTRSVPSGKTYNRKKEKQRIGKEFRNGFDADFLIEPLQEH